MIEHCSENLLRAPILTYSRQQLVNPKRQCCFPSSTAITLLKQCDILKFRGRRLYGNFSVRPRPFFHQAVNPDNLAPIKKAPSQASTPTSRFINSCLLNTRSVKNKIMKVKDCSWSRYWYLGNNQKVASNRKHWWSRYPYSMSDWLPIFSCSDIIFPRLAELGYYTFCWSFRRIRYSFSRSVESIRRVYIL